MESHPSSGIDVKGIIFVMIVLILTAISAYPQTAFSGRVVEVLDGKTVVIEMSNARLKVVLQYIETPELEQPLYQTVKEHLSKMVLDQIVDFRPLGFNAETTTGKLMLKGVDVGQQLLRDGAAWHAVAEAGGQTPAEQIGYQRNEAQAKAEKRGVWGVPDLKPPWEFRFEKARAEEVRRLREYERQKLSVVAAAPKIAPRPVQVTQNYADFSAWADIRSIDREAGVGGIISKYDAARRFGYNLTTQAQITVNGAPKAPYLDFRMGYIYGYNSAGKVSGWAIVILSDADEYKFAKSNALIVFADKEKIELGKAYRFYGDTGAARRETLVYLISRANILRIANADEVRVKVGPFSGDLGTKVQGLAKNLLKVSE